MQTGGAMGRTNLTTTVGCFMILFCSFHITNADIPQIITYQGRVTDTTGDIVPNGDYDMKFVIYDDPTAGAILWNSGTLTVSVTGGIFSVHLGKSPQPPISLSFDEDYWIEVVIDGDDQSPRTQLGSVGYSYMSSGIVPGTEITGSISTGTNAALKGSNMATSGFNHGLYGESISNGGTGVYGFAISTTGPNYGILGETNSSSGHGVYGYASNTSGSTFGGYFRAISNDGIGVYGEVFNPNGTTYGGRFRSSSSHGTGIKGEATSPSGSTFGVYGESVSTSGTAVYGLSSASTGLTYGLFGETYSPDGIGVTGVAFATSGSAQGGYFYSSAPDGDAIFAGAYGLHGSGNGGYFYSNNDTGAGVYAEAVDADGVTYGVYGSVTSTNGYGVYFSGGLAGTGTKSCVVKTSKGPTLLYCQESPECWFEDFGRGRLENGHVYIELDRIFLETVSINDLNPMNVFIQLRDECNGVYVKEGLSGFDVIELHDGRSSASFVYRVVAKRKGFESKRLNTCNAAESDAYLYPELRKDPIEPFSKR